MVASESEPVKLPLTSADAFLAAAVAPEAGVSPAPVSSVAPGVSGAYAYGPAGDSATPAAFPTTPRVSLMSEDISVVFKFPFLVFKSVEQLVSFDLLQLSPDPTSQSYKEFMTAL